MEASSTSEITDQNYSSEASYLKMALRIVEIDGVMEELAIKKKFRNSPACSSFDPNNSSQKVIAELNGSENCVAKNLNRCNARKGRLVCSIGRFEIKDKVQSQT